MKKERIIEIIILTVFFALITAGILLFRHYKYEKPNTYNIIFKDIDSILKGSPVRFMGINVGYVVKLKRKDKFIICKIKITKKGVKIPDLTRAKVAFNGLGGSKSIELMPPLTNGDETGEIIAEESLRINDLAGVVRDLNDVAVVIYNFVEGIDPIIFMNTMKEATDPQTLERVDSDIDKIIKKQNEFSGAKNKSGIFESFIDKLNSYFKYRANGSKNSQ